MSSPKRVKAELLQVGIFFLIHLFTQEVLLLKKLEIKKTKATFITSVCILGGLSFFEIQLLFIKIPREGNWVPNKIPARGNSALGIAE